MPLMTFEHCWRGRTDCSSFSAIESMPPDVTEEQLETLSFKPPSFICAGCVHEQHRTIPQDAYRLCIVNREVDEMSDNDEQDLAHLVSVITHAQAVIAARKTLLPKAHVMTHDGGIAEVDLVQHGA